MNEIVRRRVDPGALVWGIALIAFGVLALLHRLRIGDLDRLFYDWWPMVFVVIGVAKLACGNVWGGFWFIGIGGWVQIAHLGLWGVTFGSSWPLILVAVGAAIILRALIDTQRRREGSPPEERHG